jgi:site-specific DNA recombinase
MEKIAIYVRSSKDRHNVSCDAQEEQLRRIAQEREEFVYRVFRDQELSSTRDHRPEFEEMLKLAVSKDRPFSKIYCLDTSRFGRNEHESGVLLHELRRRHGVEVQFANLPNTGTHIDATIESVFRAFDQFHSLQSKEKGVASMKQNVLNGYRAGGRAPYGYALEKVEQGRNRSGTVYKSKLVPDLKTAPIIQEYFSRRANSETRRAILDDFYIRGIPSPSGRSSWPVASGKALEDNIEVYLGHTVFNRHNERIKERGTVIGYAGGKKWRDREAWVVSENTHEPLISPETAARIRHIRESGLRDSPVNKQVYPLSGTLKCALCGTHYTGDNGIYRCNAKVKPGHTCSNNGISSTTIEDAVFEFIGEKVMNFENLKAVIARIKAKLDINEGAIDNLKSRLDSIQRERGRLLELYRRALIDDSDVEGELTLLNQQRDAVQAELNRIRDISGVTEVSDRMIAEVISRFSEEVRTADPQIKKRVVQTLFEEILISPKEGNPWERTLEIRGVYLPLTGVFVASPRGFEPLLPT